MLKIVVILTIVFLNYCEINAVSPLTINETHKIEKKYASPKNILRERGKNHKETETQTKYTSGSREDISSPYSDFIQDNNGARYNYFKQGVVQSRRFLQKYSVENIKKNKKHYHRSKKTKETTKKRDSSNNEEDEDNSSRSINSSSDKKHKKHDNKFKFKDHNKNVKYSEDTIMIQANEDDHTNKNKQAKENEKDEKENKSMDRFMDKGDRTGLSGISNKTKQAKEKSSLRFREKAMVERGEMRSRNKNSVSSKNYHIQEQKRAQEKSKNILKKQSKQSKSTDILKITKPTRAAVLRQSLASTKNSKPAQATTTAKNIPTTTTTKPELQLPVQMRTQKKKNFFFYPQSHLRTHKRLKEEQKRATLMEALSLDNKKVDPLRQNENKKEKWGTPLSNLSPYAIIAQIEELMKEFPKANVSMTKVARTVEYNDIVLVTIKENEERRYFRTRESKYIDDVPEKKIIFIVHGLAVMGLKHLPALVQNSELQILLSYYMLHLDKFDLYLMPLANPDGYSASLSSDRLLWNKNVSPQSVCSGVFVDRNFDVAWNGSHGVSSCSQLYPGETPFSEEESKAVRDVFHHYGHKILAYINVHSGSFDEEVFKGDAVLYPRGYTETQSDDDKYIDMKGEIEEAMKNASFRVMSVTVDTLANWYGVVSGTSVDYAATVYGIPYAMEFVMQIYDTESLNNNALTEIWSRLIYTIFDNMWKSLQKGADARRRRYY